jgi:hypothetical protein
MNELWPNEWAPLFSEGLPYNRGADDFLLSAGINSFERRLMGRGGLQRQFSRSMLVLNPGGEDSEDWHAVEQALERLTANIKTRLLPIVHATREEVLDFFQKGTQELGELALEFHAVVNELMEMRLEADPKSRARSIWSRAQKLKGLCGDQRGHLQGLFGADTIDEAHDICGLSQRDRVHVGSVNHDVVALATNCDTFFLANDFLVPTPQEIKDLCEPTEIAAANVGLQLDVPERSDRNGPETDSLFKDLEAEQAYFHDQIDSHKKVVWKRAKLAGTPLREPTKLAEARTNQIL